MLFDHLIGATDNAERPNGLWLGARLYLRWRGRAMPGWVRRPAMKRRLNPFLEPERIQPYVRKITFPFVAANYNCDETQTPPRRISKAQYLVEMQP